MKSYRAIAEFYDAENEHRRMLQQDVPLLLSRLPRRSQSILELAVGTARAAIPLAQAGHRVVGVDYDPKMLQIAAAKRDAAGLTASQLQLVRGDVLRLRLNRKFDWIILLFNTFLGFPTLSEQDALLAGVVRHLKRAGKFWIDVFNPDLSMLAKGVSEDLDPSLFYVPALGRTVQRTTTVRRDPLAQLQKVTFHYRWFNRRGIPQRATRQFTMTYLMPRELGILVERHGLRIERMFGNYDASPLTDDSPRMIAQCRR
jgi:ubiquinone/menaquinone biosynthesis C-methylase UbiE